MTMIKVLLLVGFFFPYKSLAIPCHEASLKTLDKMTGRVGTLKVPIGTSKSFETLMITVQACEQSTDTEAPEMKVFLEIYETKSKDSKEPKCLFSSWMFGSNPSVSALEHPIYDVWVDLRQTA